MAGERVVAEVVTDDGAQAVEAFAEVDRLAGEEDADRRRDAQHATTARRRESASASKRAGTWMRRPEGVSSVKSSEPFSRDGRGVTSTKLFSFASRWSFCCHDESVPLGIPLRAASWLQVRPSRLRRANNSSISARRFLDRGVGMDESLVMARSSRPPRLRSRRGQPNAYAPRSTGRGSGPTCTPASASAAPPPPPGTGDPEALFSLAGGYLALHGRSGASISRHTLRSYRHGIGELLAFAGETGAGLLRPARSDWGALFARWLEDQGRSPSTVRVRLAAARALYQALRWAGATVADPFHGVRAAVDRTEAYEKCPPYSEKEVDRLLKAASPRDRVAVLLGAHGGLRVSEAAALAWKAVDLDAGELRIRRGKGRKDRTVLLSGSMRRALEELRVAAPPEAQQARVLNLTVRGLQAVLDRLTKRAGVPRRGFHALRHSAGSRLYAETNDLGTVADHLGHKSLDTARRYAKRSRAIRATLQRW